MKELKGSEVREGIAGKKEVKREKEGNREEGKSKGTEMAGRKFGQGG